ncbi:MAG: hypothetical protein ACOCQM_06580 [Natronomonas sp.]
MVEPTIQLVVAVAVGALAVAAAAWVESLPFSEATVLATGPWTVAASGVVVAADVGVYDGVPFVTVPTLLVSLLVVALGIWLAFTGIAELRNRPHSERYLAASGAGAATVVLGSLLFTASGVTPVRLAWVALAVVAAPVVAVGPYFVLSLVYTDAVARLRFAGLYGVAAVVFDGVASAIATEALGTGREALVTSVLSLAAGTAGTSPSGWQLLAAHAVVGVVAVAALGRIGRWRPAVGYAGTAILSVTALGSGTVVLLSSVLFG